MNFLVINLKKNIFTILILLFTLALIFFSENNFIAAKNGFNIFTTSVLPSLFPFLIATEILYKTNITYLLGKLFSKFTKTLFNVPGESISAIFLGTFSGYPIGAKMVCNLKKDKIISKTEAERLISYTNNSNPLFILSTVGIAMYSSKELGFKLLYTNLLSSFIVALIFRFWKKDIHDNLYLTKSQVSNSSLIKLSNLSEILSNAIKNSIQTLLVICGFIVIFSIIISILEVTNFFNIFSYVFTLLNIPPEASKPILSGIIEITNGINLSSHLNSNFSSISISITAFLLGFGGLSIMMQIYSIISKENISIKPYFYGKLLQGILSSILILFFI